MSLHKKISQNIKYLSPMEQQILQQLLQRRGEFGFQNFTIANVAKTLSVSTTSLHRMVKKLDYDSFILFKNDFFGLLDVDGKDVGTQSNDYLYMLSETYKQVKTNFTQEMLDHFLRAKRITIYGMGMNNYIGKMFQTKLEISGIRTEQHDDSGFMRLSSRTLQKDDDVIIILSRSGKPEELIEVMVEANLREIYSLLITETANSPISQMVSDVLYTAKSLEPDSDVDTRVNVHLALDVITKIIIEHKK